MQQFARLTCLAALGLALFAGGCTEEAPDGPEVTVTRTFAVEGMTCEGCVGSIEKAVAAMPGVVEVEVRLAEKTATVKSQSPGGPEPGAIIAAIQKLQYRASLSKTSATPATATP